MNGRFQSKRNFLQIYEIEVVISPFYSPLHNGVPHWQKPLYCVDGYVRTSESTCGLYKSGFGHNQQSGGKAVKQQVFFCEYVNFVQNQGDGLILRYSPFANESKSVIALRFPDLAICMNHSWTADPQRT